MPKKLSFFLTLIIFLNLLPASPVLAAGAVDGDFRGVWVSTVLNMDYPSKKGLTVQEMKKEADGILEDAVRMGFNAVVLQVRPNADAIYPSQLFPWSEYLTGAQGQAPADSFDPLAYWIEQAHKKGLELHAWINPYRVTHTSAKITDANRLAASNPARLHPSWVVPYKGALYFDPGLPESKKLIIDGVAEIVRNYAVDGIHLDDYFYPGTDFDDSASYAQYGQGQAKDDWRRENVNEVIRGIQTMVKAYSPKIRFGVSPFAIWQNKASNPLGSDTSGNEAYKAMYADTRKWVKENWLDYICPQIYWNIGFDKADYQKVLNWWADVVKDTKVDLYVGHAAYKEADSAAGWPGEILRQLEMNESLPGVKGSVFFRAGSLKGKVGEQIQAYYAARPMAAAPAAPSIKMTELSLAQPEKDLSVTGVGYHLMGTCNPDQPLLLNGAAVPNVTPEGFFSVYASLTPGENVFAFTQGQQAVTRTITGKRPTSSGASGSSSTRPMKEYDRAPYYATVTAEACWLYPEPSDNKGSAWLLTKGQKDRVTAVTDDGKWVRLASGLWAEEKNLTRAMESALVADVLSDGKYIPGDNQDLLVWKATANPGVTAFFDGKELTVSFGLQEKAPGLALDQEALDNTLFQKREETILGEAPAYVFTLKEGARLEGFYTGYANGEFQLILKKPRKLAEGEKPLSGFTIVVDAGHGKDDTGALGPMGQAMPEKAINLANADKLAAKLEALGARVVKVRSGDVFYTLAQRTEISRAAHPDLFLSLHANSLKETADPTNAHGLTVWYRNPNSKPLAEALMESLCRINPLSSRQPAPNQSNLYVCRPSWAPSVIVEASFMNNVQDFAWLIDGGKQDQLAEGLAKAVVAYFKN